LPREEKISRNTNQFGITIKSEEENSIKGGGRKDLMANQALSLEQIFLVERTDTID